MVRLSNVKHGGSERRSTLIDSAPSCLWVLPFVLVGQVAGAPAAEPAEPAVVVVQPIAAALKNKVRLRFLCCAGDHSI